MRKVPRINTQPRLLTPWASQGCFLLPAGLFLPHLGLQPLAQHIWDLIALVPEVDERNRKHDDRNRNGHDP